MLFEINGFSVVGVKDAAEMPDGNLQYGGQRRKARLSVSCLLSRRAVETPGVTPIKNENLPGTARSRTTLRRKEAEIEDREKGGPDGR